MRLILAIGWMVAALAAASLAWAGQRPAQQAGGAGAQQAAVEAREPADSVPVAVNPATYIIGPEDVLFVRVWREPELSGPVVVRPDGKITLPLVGDIPAAGLTPEKLDTAVTQAYAKFINNPEIIISVQAVRSKRYYVTGEVNRPGAYPLVTPTTVLEALTLAGGFREFANKKNITILRGTQRLKFNYNDVVKGKNLSQNILLEHGDYIIVP